MFCSTSTITSRTEVRVRDRGLSYEIYVDKDRSLNTYISIKFCLLIRYQLQRNRVTVCFVCLFGYEPIYVVKLKAQGIFWCILLLSWEAGLVIL